MYQGGPVRDSQNPRRIVAPPCVDNSCQEICSSETYTMQNYQEISWLYRAGSLLEILIYLPDGSHFSWVPMSFHIQGEVPIPDRYTTQEKYTDLDNVPDLKMVPFVRQIMLGVNQSWIVGVAKRYTNVLLTNFNESLRPCTREGL